MICSKCGANLQDGVRFCEICGAAVEVPAVPAYQAPAYQAPAAPAYQAPAAPAYQAPAAPAYQAPAAAPAYQAPVYQAPAYQAPVYEAPAPVEEKTNVAKLIFSIVSIVCGIFGAILSIILMEDFDEDGGLITLLITIAGVVFGCISVSGGKKPLSIVGIVFGAIGTFLAVMAFGIYA